MAWPTAVPVTAGLAALVQWGSGATSADGMPGATTVAGLLHTFAWSAAGEPITLALQLMALVVLSRIVARAVSPPAPAGWRPMLGPLLLVALIGIAPIRDVVGHRLPGLWLLAMVVFDLGLTSGGQPRQRWRGIALGIAASATPVLALFAVFLPTARRRAALGRAASSFLVVSAIAWLIRPDESNRYWPRGGLLGAGQAADASNQSLRGLGLRLELHGTSLIAVWLVVAVPVLVLALLRSRRYWRDGQPLLAVVVMGCAVMLIEPVSGSAGQLWLGFTVLCLSTALALIGYWAYPLAPPRLTPGHGYRDTLHPGADAHPFGAFTKFANQFAAMPSLHIAWSSWCALVLLTLAPYLWVRVLGALYPVCTLFVILATANHWIVDAAGGALTLAIAAWLQHALTGQRIAEAPSNPAARSRLTAGDRFTSARVEGDRARARIAGDRQ